MGVGVAGPHGLLQTVSIAEHPHIRKGFRLADAAMYDNSVIRGVVGSDVTPHYRCRRSQPSSKVGDPLQAARVRGHREHRSPRAETNRINAHATHDIIEIVDIQKRFAD